MRTLSASLSFIMFVLAAFAGTALAATAAHPDDGSLLELAAPILEAVKNGHGWLAAACSVMFLTALARRKLPDRFGGKFARGDVGGMVTAFVFAYAGAVATAATAEGFAGMTSTLALAGLKVALAAIGGFVALHKLATALAATKWWNEKAPRWLRATVELVLKLVGSSAAQKAKAAGDAAVKAKPAAGFGEPTDVN